MKANFCSGLPEEKLEQFLLNLLPAQIAGSIYDESVVQIENHLLLCPNCLDFAETHDLLVRALRAKQAHARKSCIAAGLPLPN